MNDIKDGGAAFPFNDGFNQPDAGMTLRDYFAGQVLIGLSISRNGKTDAHDAVLAYSLADAMLKERSL